DRLGALGTGQRSEFAGGAQHEGTLRPSLDQVVENPPESGGVHLAGGCERRGNGRDDAVDSERGFHERSSFRGSRDVKAMPPNRMTRVPRTIARKAWNGALAADSDSGQSPAVERVIQVMTSTPQVTAAAAAG